MIKPNTAVFSVGGMKSLKPIPFSPIVQKHAQRNRSRQRVCDPAHEYAAEIRDQRQQRQHQHAGQNARSRQIFVRIHRRRFHGIDLLGHFHGSQLRADARAHAPAHHQSGDDGAALLDHREHDDLPAASILRRIGSGCRAFPATAPRRWPRRPAPPAAAISSRSHPSDGATRGLQWRRQRRTRHPGAKLSQVSEPFEKWDDVLHRQAVRG